MDGPSTTKPAVKIGLGSLSVLAKIDKLRELNVGTDIPLPQLVVVGDQSSGKSSVLESLTGFSFPRATGLCTRYATQITCCREPDSSVVISIIPRPDADDALKERLLQFQRRVTDLDNDMLAEVFEEANRAMGIRMSPQDTDATLGAFSEDILKIEISGPEEDHLTVIDVPGIFRVPTPGLTTESDIQLVENTVKSYMSSGRTIILAVLPCTADVATQEIVKLAETADPSGTRTMGVLTKPDLATERATRAAIVDLVLGKGGTALRLGHYVVKNRSADDGTSTPAERVEAERAFFADPAWSAIRDRCGVASLKGRLHELLVHISTQGFPHVRSEIEARLRLHGEALRAMGPSRADQNSQRRHLGRLAERFQEVTRAALRGHYAGEELFRTDPELKLITRIVKLNEVFSDVFWKRGHSRSFGPTPDNESETALGEDLDDVLSYVPPDSYTELYDIVRTSGYACPELSESDIATQIQEVYESNRGPELGTFGGAILAIMFEKQSKNWEPLVLSHTSEAISLVHEFIHSLLAKLCPEEQVRKSLWDDHLVDQLRDAYAQAMTHARFLLAMERDGPPITFNHYFNSILQKKRAERLQKLMESLVMDRDPYGGDGKDYVRLADLRKQVVDKDNSQQVCEDIHDSLVSYYTVARKRMVDVVCQHVVHHFLLEGEQSPLRVLGPDLVMGLAPEQLEAIAGEDDGTKRKRQGLEREIERLKAAVDVIRG